MNILEEKFGKDIMDVLEKKFEGQEGPWIVRGEHRWPFNLEIESEDFRVISAGLPAMSTAHNTPEEAVNFRPANVKHLYNLAGMAATPTLIIALQEITKSYLVCVKGAEKSEFVENAILALKSALEYPEPYKKISE